ncbi:hypothetical protein Afe04nite_60220 [Asanoa ferruginea]|nr:hypothetical protein Afe04nite_60220 [Asanoa ferruginea]
MREIQGKDCCQTAKAACRAGTPPDNARGGCALRFVDDDGVGSYRVTYTATSSLQ